MVLFVLLAPRAVLKAFAAALLLFVFYTSFAFAHPIVLRVKKFVRGQIAQVSIFRGCGKKQIQSIDVCGTQKHRVRGLMCLAHYFIGSFVSVEARL